jgi:hypothetical protein
MISIICVFNDRKILNEYLLNSLKKQTAKYEQIFLDNIQGQYKSAAEALNYGGRKAKEKYIMFIHQDVDLCSSKWLEDTENMLSSLSNLGIVGVAGAKDEKGVITNLRNGTPPKLAGCIQIKKPIKVQTLDECLVIIPKTVFQTLQFDERVCDNWHLYVVDYCLSVKRLGLDVYVLPSYVYHQSTGKNGKYSKGYRSTLTKLLKKHKNHFSKIYTTCGNWNGFSHLLFKFKKFQKR